MIDTTGYMVEGVGGGNTALVRRTLTGPVLVLSDGNLGHDVNGDHAEPVFLVFHSVWDWENGADPTHVHDNDPVTARDAVVLFGIIP